MTTATTAPASLPLFMPPAYRPEPDRPDDDETYDVDDLSAMPSGAGPTTAVRMTPGAREAAERQGVTPAEIAAAIADPTDVRPHPQKAGRVTITGKGLVLVAGDDGMVLVVRRDGAGRDGSGRDRSPRRRRR